MSRMSRNKGKRGERAVIDWLQPIVDEIAHELKVKTVLLQRNTVQSDRGGSDLVGLDWLGAEVKNCESLTPQNLANWWAQCCAQCDEFSTGKQKLTPVLFYTKNRCDIRVRMWGWIGGTWDGAEVGPGIAALVDVDAAYFEEWFRVRLRHEFARHQRL